VCQLEADDVRDAAPMSLDPRLDAGLPDGAEAVEHGEHAVGDAGPPGGPERRAHVGARLLVHERGDLQRPRARVTLREPLDTPVDVGDVREIRAPSDERADAAERASLRCRHRGFGRA